MQRNKKGHSITVKGSAWRKYVRNRKCSGNEVRRKVVTRRRKEEKGIKKMRGRKGRGRTQKR